MLSAVEVDKLLDAILSQIDNFMRTGSTSDNLEIRRRQDFLFEVDEVLSEWKAARPSKIEYGNLYANLPQLRKALIYLAALTNIDADTCAPFRVSDEEEDFFRFLSLTTWQIWL